METKSRNAEVQKRLDDIFAFIEDEKYGQAGTEINQLKRDLRGSIPDLVEAEALIKMMDVDFD